MSRTAPPLTALAPGDPFPPAHLAWGPGTPAPGLLAVGGALDETTLAQAYAQGIFPWFSAGQPILWWSPDPRMVLAPHQFRLHRSLRKTLKRHLATPGCAITVDTAFDRVIQACATTPRAGQQGTWIVPSMQRAYLRLHEAGLAHSVETWVDGELVGGLYCVAIGRAVFGESMFAWRSDASKLALCALVALCRAQGVTQIDCQQNTAHLASMGACEVPRALFLDGGAAAAAQPALAWRLEPVYWTALS